MKVKQQRHGHCYSVIPVVLLHTMSGQHSRNTEQESRVEEVVLPPQVVQLEDLQDMLQAMVDKAINDQVATCPLQQTIAVSGLQRY